MGKIDEVQAKVLEAGYFSHLSNRSNYMRILDTPHAWGAPFGQDGVMPAALARQAAFERVVLEILHKTRHRCDVASLNSPDPDWARVILRAMDQALSAPVRDGELGRPIQFRFLFGQTPLYPTSPPPNYVDFRAALLRLVRTRNPAWQRLPDIWLGRFFRLQDGVLSSLKTKVFSSDAVDDDGAKMTWNHTKIIAADGAEALVGGHNLNMDLFRSYPPVHDVSVVVHGEAAYGAQQFLNQMWECGADLLAKENLDVSQLSWREVNGKGSAPADPLLEALPDLHSRWETLERLHQAAERSAPTEPASDNRAALAGSPEQRVLLEVELPVFAESTGDGEYAALHEYTRATRVLSVGKYWTGPNKATDYQQASELMKETLIKSAQRTLCLSQMDLVSAWKKNWSDHVVCQWLIEALLANPELTVNVVVSPLDGGAGAEGDQYSFGSGAQRTFELIEYYMTHDVQTDAELPDQFKRQQALKRLAIAPLHYTDTPAASTREGQTYFWPDLPGEGLTATLKQPPLSIRPPRAGVIGSAMQAVVNASGNWYDKVFSAPGNHAKIMIVDDEVYVVGSDNLYPGYLSEFNFLVEGRLAVDEMVNRYWEPLWRHSRPHRCHRTT